MSELQAGGQDGMPPLASRLSRTATGAYLLLTIAAVAFVYGLCYLRPLAYIPLTQEDNFGEYATSVAFGATGVILLLLAIGSDRPWRRVVSGLIGAFALFVGGEEISWGQRLLGLETPAALHEVNYQGELTLHNVDYLSSTFIYVAVGAVLLVWALASLCVEIVRPRLESVSAFRAVLREFGVFLMPIPLMSVFLLPHACLALHPIAKGEEIAELSLGIGALLWAVYLRHNNATARGRSEPLTLMTVGALGVVAAVGAALTLASHQERDRTASLHFYASDYFPRVGLYTQANDIFEHLYADPEALEPSTRLHHARMLLDRDDPERAAEILDVAITDLRAEAENSRDSELFRLLGIGYLLLGDREMANASFVGAIEIDRITLAATPAPDDQARAQWSMARTSFILNYATAIPLARDSLNRAQAAGLRLQIGQWLGCMGAPGQTVSQKWLCTATRWPELLIRPQWTAKKPHLVCQALRLCAAA